MLDVRRRTLIFLFPLLVASLVRTGEARAQRNAVGHAPKGRSSVVLKESTRSYDFEQYLSDHGLPSDRIEAVMQDREGFIWVGTPSGLARYDGYEFVVFRNDPADSTSIVDDYVMGVFEDSRGRLWISSLDKGLSCLDRRTGRCTRYLGSATVSDRWACSVRQMVEDHAGVLWVGTGAGLYQLKPGASAFTRFILAGSDGSARISGYVRSLCKDAEGRLWLGTNSGGIECISRDRKQRRVYREVPGIPNGPGTAVVRRILRDYDNRLWFIGDDGVRVYRPESDDFLFLRFLRSDGTPFPFRDGIHGSEDLEGNLWIGTTTSGLFVIDRMRERFVHLRHVSGDASGIPSNEVLVTSAVRNPPPVGARLDDGTEAGSMWIGSARSGLLRSTTGQRHFRNIDLGAVSGGQDFGTILGIRETAGGDLYLSSTTQRILRLDSAYRTVEEIPNPTDEIVYGMHVDDRGALWLVGRETIHIRRKGQRRFKTVLPVDATKRRSLVTHFYGLTSLMDARGDLWLGTYDGMRKYSPATNIVTPGVLPRNQGVNEHLPTVRALCLDQSGRLWIGYQAAGVLVYDPDNPSAPGATVRYRVGDPHSLSSDKVYSIFVDRRGGKWIGTANGLNFYDEQTGQCTRYFRPPYDIPTFIYNITEDERGYLWLRSNTGLLRFDRRTGTFRTFGRIDGYTLRGIMSLARLRDGRMLAGGLNQITVFDPDHMRIHRQPPRILLTSVMVGTTPAAPLTHVPALTRLRCAPDQNSLSFTFSALTFTEPRRSQYAYMLEGLDTAWTYCGDRRYASYTHLPPGEYTFRVRAADHRGVWNNTGAALKIHIDTPLWRKAWFAALVVLLLAAMLAWTVRRRLAALGRERRLQQEFTELFIQAQEGERRRIAAELHDGVGQSLLLLKNHALWCLQRLQDIRPQLEQITAIATETIEDVRRISRNLHPYQLERLGMTKALHALAEPVERAGIEIECSLDNIDGRFDRKRGLLLYRIVQEAFSNTIRHSFASRLKLVVRAGEQRTEIRIEDDGRGFDFEHAMRGEGGLGLYSIHERVRILGGTIEVVTRPSSGCTLNIIIPDAP